MSPSNTVLDMIVRAGHNSSCVMKRDIKDTFRNLRISLGKSRRHVCNSAYVLSLSYFAEGFHWILQSCLNWKFLTHYLDDFIRVIPHDVATLDYLAQRI